MNERERNESNRSDSCLDFLSQVHYKDPCMENLATGH